jgi:maltooligosyltrehalose trehalohydrolase
MRRRCSPANGREIWTRSKRDMLRSARDTGKNLRHHSDFQFGPRLVGSGSEFRIWAPAPREIALETAASSTQVMRAGGNGWHSVGAPVGVGTRYQFRVGEDLLVPDPASRAQDGDIGNASVVVDPNAYRWQCDDWRGRPWEEAILYELHVGLLGGFEGVAAQLERIASLGFTAVELMPVADFPGRRNWGYDGVLPFAPDRAYGTPEQLKQLIDRAHALGLMVFLDVVYNHFGPDGNWLAEYAPQFFRPDRKTPWGDAIDFREPMVRRFFIENALYWIHEYRFDGLRLDAVHAIRDDEFLPELAAEVRDGVPAGRYVHLVVENDDNDAGLLRSGYDAQWNDDFHHALHVLLTHETAGYYADYADGSAGALARVLGEGFVYQGEVSRHRGGARGTPSTGLPPTAFVSFLQNHDQIGNRAFGERLTVLAEPQALRAAIALQLLCPQIPLVFMGEEAGAREPFLYFTDHNSNLADAVRTGRRREFAKFPEFSDPVRREQIPDPNAPETFERSRPSFEGVRAADWNALYAQLIALRREHVIPRLKGARAEGAEVLGEGAVLAHWRMGDGARLTLALNLGRHGVTGHFPRSAPLWGKAGPDLDANSTKAWMET